MSDWIQEKLHERETKKQRAERLQAKQDAALKLRISKKLKGVTLVAKKPFWWLPAFFRSRVMMAARIAELDGTLLTYADFSARQSAHLKLAYKLILDIEQYMASGFGFADIMDRIENLKKELGPLDPTSVFVKE